MNYKLNLKQDEIDYFNVVQDHRTTTELKMGYDSWI